MDESDISIAECENNNNNSDDVRFCVGSGVFQIVMDESIIDKSDSDSEPYDIPELEKIKNENASLQYKIEELTCEIINRGLDAKYILNNYSKLCDENNKINDINNKLIIGGIVTVGSFLVYGIFGIGKYLINAKK